MKNNDVIFDNEHDEYLSAEYLTAGIATTNKNRSGCRENLY